MRGLTHRWQLPLSLALWAAAASALDLTALQPQGYVSDFARVVGATSRADLEGFCARVERATGAQLAFVTVESLDGEPIEDAANTLFRRWGIGQKTENNGLLFLLAIRDRRSRIEVGYGLEPIIPDGYGGSVLREMRPALREQHYGEALMIAAHRIGERIAAAKGVNLDLPPGRPVPRRSPEPIPWPVIFGGLGFLIWSMMMAARSAHRMRRGLGGFLPGLLLGNLLGRRGGYDISGWGGRGGGGFGGYDSGDSFGGFGGGDSGGGGASSDW